MDSTNLLYNYSLQRFLKISKFAKTRSSLYRKRRFEILYLKVELNYFELRKERVYLNSDTIELKTQSHARTSAFKDRGLQDLKVNDAQWFQRFFRFERASDAFYRRFIIKQREHASLAVLAARIYPFARRQRWNRLASRVREFTVAALAGFQREMKKSLVKHGSRSEKCPRRNLEYFWNGINEPRNAYSSSRGEDHTVRQTHFD